MSTEDLQALAEIILEPKKKTENRKILVILIVGLIPSVLLGMDIGDWHEWRHSTETRVTRLENQAPQNVRNAERAEKNRNVRIHDLND